MWSTELTEHKWTGGQLYLAVKFTRDDGVMFSQDYTLSAAPDKGWLEGQIAARILAVDGLLAYAATLSKGLIVPAPVVTVDLVENPARAAFFALVGKLAVAKSALEPTDKRLIELQAQVTEAFDPSF